MTMHYPKSEKDWLALRHIYISSTESAALFGFSPYSTPFEMAVSKKSAEPPQIDRTERMGWGLRLQEAIAKGISEDYGVKVRRVNGYAVHDSARMGASFDYEIVGIATVKDLELDEERTRGVEDPVLQQMYTDLGPGILEIKNVDAWVFRAEWKEEDGQLEAPSHIEIQVQHQLECIGRKWGVMGVLIGGNRTELVLRERDEEVGKAIVKKVTDFWALLESGGMPPIKLPADVDIIRKLYAQATPGKVLDAQEDAALLKLCQDYKHHALVRDDAENMRKSVGAQILMKIGDAEKAILSDGFSVSANTVSPAEIKAYTRAGYRNLKVNKKEVKA